MNYEIITTEDFERNFRRLGKKYASLPDDYERLIEELLENPRLGTDLGNHIRKVRMAITSKNKGKRGGARVITCNVLVSISNTDIYLLTIYDKGEKDSISRKEILQLKIENNLV
ncbi:MAG: type II toxin-antitoxin system RelE/ParE family toxin [Tannerella sp.]|jgi:hypothetical protein|nr:type II toxin-antitoxin system RelE/ParE family toxin [Tannerella sp.]